MKNLYKILDLSKEDIMAILDTADKLKFERKNNIPHKILEGKSIGMIFEKSSTRTRVSFEVGIAELGATPLFLSSADLQIGRGEPIEDTARVLARYLHGIMIRTFEQEKVEKLGDYSGLPIINGLTDFSHPCQVLADLMTIKEFKKDFDGLKLCYIGDGNNMCNSLVVGALKVGMQVDIACPEGYTPDPLVLEFAKNYPFAMYTDPKEAVKNADVIITDVWTSMGQEDETEKRKQAFAGYILTMELLNACNDDYMVLHCLPAHREEEISTEVFEANAKYIFEEAENRLHAQKAVMAMIF
ncbi:MAG: ornithine carbamoyltransferase [Bacillota bacterium]